MEENTGHNLPNFCLKILNRLIVNKFLLKIPLIFGFNPAGNTMSQKFKCLYLLDGLPDLCDIWQPKTRNTSKCVSQITSDSTISCARYGDLNGS